MTESRRPDLVASKQVHRSLHAAWKPALLSMGFSRIGSSAAYRREVEGRWQTLQVQIDKCGWQAWAGGCFTVTLGWYDEPDRYGTPRPGARWPALLSDLDLAAARALQERIRDDATPAVGTAEEMAFAAFWEGTWNAQACLDGPYRQTSEIWLRYRRPEDVTVWGEFFAARLPRMMTDFGSSWSQEQAAKAWPWAVEMEGRRRRRDAAYAELGIKKTPASVAAQLRRHGEDVLATWMSTLGPDVVNIIWQGLEHPDPDAASAAVAQRAQFVLEGTPRPLASANRTPSGNWPTPTGRQSK